MQAFKNLSEFKQAVLGSPELLKKLQDSPQQFLTEVEEDPIKDKSVFLTVVWIVAGVLILAVITGGMIALEKIPCPPGTNCESGFLSREIPDFIIMLASTALGALAGLLVPADN